MKKIINKRNRRLKHKLTICLTCAVFLLCSCNNNAVDEPESIDIDNNNGKAIEIVLSGNIGPNNDEAMAQYAEELMKEVGWDINISFYDIDNPDQAERKEKYIEQLRNYMLEEKNTLVELRYGIDELISENLVLDVGSDNHEYYYKIGNSKKYYFTGVFINQTIESEYGKSINGIEEYDKFLDWVKTRHSDKKPGLMIMNDTTSDMFNPLAFFAQENGFIRIDKGLGAFLYDPTMLFIDVNDMHQNELTDINIYNAAELPFFGNMDIMLNDWKSNDKMHYSNYADVDDFHEYASIVMNMSNSTNHYSSTRFDLFYASEYNLHIFRSEYEIDNSPRVTRYEHESMFAISAKSSTVSLIHGFLDWLYESTDNYILFMYGKEGIDYTVTDGQIAFLRNDKGLVYGEWNKHRLFHDTSMNISLPQFPNNWEMIEETLADIEHSNLLDIVSDKQDLAVINTFIYDTVLNENNMNEFTNDVTSLYRTYFYQFLSSEASYGLDDLKQAILSSSTAEMYEKEYRKLFKALSSD